LFCAHLAADAAVDDHQLLAANQERPQTEADAVARIGRRTLLPQRLRHDTEHRPAVETELAVGQRHQFESAKLHMRKTIDQRPEARARRDNARPAFLSGLSPMASGLWPFPSTPPALRACSRDE